MATEPHPQVRALLDMLDEQNTPPTYGVSPEAAREQYVALTEMMEPTEVGDVQDFAIEGPDGAIPVRAYVPDGEGPFPVLVYYHGGGWVIGNLDTHDNVCTGLCARAEVVVLSVDYRLAPEHPFPAQLEDAYAAAEWATEFAGDIAGDPDRVAVGGDSAGGNLTAAVTLMANDRGGPDLAHQVLIYPAVASPAVHEFDSYEENAEGYFLERPSMEWFYGKWVQSEAHARNEYLAPLLARDLSGLPPATVVTAGFDPLRDEGAEYAERLTEAGVDVHHEHYEEMIHGFVQMMEMVDAGDEAVDVVAEELSASLRE
ncbi:MAG: alpha/beta hydrolase [Haloarculaceae archaeon]